MGLGKTYIGAEKAISLGKTYILVICQKSKVDDWFSHFYNFYDCRLYNLTKKIDLFNFLNDAVCPGIPYIGIINYELAWRRPELSQLSDFTLMLDESSLIQNETTKQAKFILNKLNPSNVILLSGTPVSGKYEALWSQCHLLGWEISKKLFYRQYVVYEMNNEGYPVIVGYKNVDRLKRKLRDYGAVFMKTEEVIDLPNQTFIPINIKETKEFKIFKKDRIIEIEGKQLIGDTTLTNLLYQRMLCGMYNQAKFDALQDLMESTNDRLIIFYNFNDELAKLRLLCEKLNKPISEVNGSVKDLSNWNSKPNTVLLGQYAAASMGLNLQAGNKIIYFTPPLSTDQFEQSKKRIHRIGQNNPCFYYELKCGIEYHIYDVLAMKKDYTDDLFKKENK